MMNDIPTISILGEDIDVEQRQMSIHDLSFYKDNPRVYSKLQENSAFHNQKDEQRHIQEMMKNEPSVQNLIPEIRQQGGLLEPIMVLHKTNSVLEGNSRLAAMRILNEEDPHNERWQTIPCRVVSNLKEEQIDAYLHQIHVKGKTPWQAYEKAHKTYKRVENDEVPLSTYANSVNESENELKKQIKTIKLMKQNKDNVRAHWSYYNILVRNRIISQHFNYNKDFRNFILKKVKKQKEGQEDFTAMEMRDKLPAILLKPKILKRFLEDKESLDDAYQKARSSNALSDVKKACGYLQKVEKKSMQKLERSSLGAIEQEIRKCGREVERLKNMVNSVRQAARS